jgi:hypothetical protein
MSAPPAPSRMATSAKAFLKAMDLLETELRGKDAPGAPR